MHKFPIGKSNLAMVALKATPLWQTYKPSGKPLPAGYPNNRHLFGDILDQKQLGSCSGFGWNQFVCAMIAQAGGPKLRLAELSQYWAERFIEGTVDQDSGATVAQGVEANQQRGAQFYDENPYTDDYYIRYKDAPNGPWFDYFKVPPERLAYITRDDNFLHNLLDALGQGYLVTAGIEVFNGIESAECANTGILPMPAPGEQSIGGHWINYFWAEVHDLATLDGYVYAINQWNKDWGIKSPVDLQGCFKIPLKYVAQYTMDAVVGYPPQTVGIIPQDPGPQTRPVHNYTLTAFFSKPTAEAGDLIEFGCKLVADGTTPVETLDTVPTQMMIDNSGFWGDVPTFPNVGMGTVPWGSNDLGTHTAQARWFTPEGTYIFSDVAKVVIVQKQAPAPKLRAIDTELVIDQKLQGVIFQAPGMKQPATMVPPAIWQQVGTATKISDNLYQVNGKNYAGVEQNNVLYIAWPVMTDNGFKMIHLSNGGWRYEKITN